MKYAFIFLIGLFANATVVAQDTGFVNRADKVLLETGYSFLSGLSGGGSGFNLIVSDGATLTTIGIDGGYFFTDNLAVRGRFGILSAGIDGESSSVTNLALGAKYYLIGKIPFSADAGILTGGGTIATFNLSGGFAIRLADNIALEPNIGIAHVDGSNAFRFAVNFAMFL